MDIDMESGTWDIDMEQLRDMAKTNVHAPCLNGFALTIES